MNRGCVANAAGVLTHGWWWEDDTRPSGVRIPVEPGGQILVFLPESDEATCRQIVTHLHLWTPEDVITELGLTPVEIAGDLETPPEGQQYSYNTGAGTVELEDIWV